MGSTTSVEQPLEEPPPLDVPTVPAQQEVAAAGLWQRMMEHAISAAATVPGVIAAPDDEPSGDGPIVTLLARAPTSLHLGVDADDAVWRAAARASAARYDVEIKEVGVLPLGAAWRVVATGSVERRHAVEGLRPNAAYHARARRAGEPWGSPSRVLRCSGGVSPSWFEALRYKRRRRADSKIEVLCFACVANRLDADVQDLLRLIHEYLAP